MMVKFIVYIILFALAVYLLTFLFIPFLIILIVLATYKIYEHFYFKSKKFLNIKNSITNYIQECNDLNEHIEELKSTYLKLNKIDYGNAELQDTSVFKYKRKELEHFKQSKNTYNCSITVCRNAQQQPFKYLCKYFNIKIDEETLNEFETTFNNFSAAEQGKELLKNKKNEIIKSIEAEIPILIKKISKKRLEKELGFQKIDFSTLYFPKYTFQYISSGGNSSMKVDIIFDLDNLEKFINYLSENIKWKKSVAGQRALMTSFLREKIKKRDNYTCKNCGNSTNKEPNLLLEIDHIIPISKNGLTVENNLQTLCWKCNRKKSNKIPTN